MSGRTKTKKKTGVGARASAGTNRKPRSRDGKGQAAGAGSAPSRTSEAVRGNVSSTRAISARREALHGMLMAKRREIMRSIEGRLGQTLTEDQQRRLEAAMDVGDQALMDLERELGISLMEMRNRQRQLIDEALTRLDEGTYGICAECGVEINEKRLAAVPFAKLCVDCQSKQELMEKIEKGEERE
ncbi:MAG: TraR/DksA family transcriptional regulator [Nitrospiraceae bacterium]